MPQTHSKTAIVTGGSRGIGAAIAVRLAYDGFNIVVNYANSKGSAQEVADTIEAAGGNAMIVEADVADAAKVKRMFDSAAAAFGGVDAIVNNAGVMKLATIAESDDALFESHIAVNLKGTFNMLREAATRIRDGGSVVNFSTTVVGLKLETYGVYAGTKAAIEAMTAIFAKEMRGRDVTVNAVAPGPTATELFLDGKSPDLIDRLANMAPLGRLGTPEDVADVVSFLVGTDGRWINGQTIRANGGVI